jgi:peptidoglycan/xylan/chitin deacetylase (PgdA/CDA1 family)
MTYDDAKFGVLPGYGSPADLVDNLKRGFDQLWDEGASDPRVMSIGLHPRLISQASRIHALREFLEHAGKKGKVWFARRLDIANWWNEHQAEFSP